MSRRDVGNEHRHEERADPAGSAFNHDARLLFERRNAANAAADQHAGTIAVERLRHGIQTGRRHRLTGRGDGELGEPVRAADLLPVHVPLGLETLHLRGEAHIEFGAGLEMGDAGGAAGTIQQRAPGRGQIVPDRRQQAGAGHDHPVSPVGAEFHARPPAPPYSTPFCCR